MSATTPRPIRLSRSPSATCAGANGIVELAQRDRYGFPVVLAACARCGLGFLSPRPTAEAYAAFYDGVYRPLVSAYHGRLIDAQTVQVEQREYAAELVEFLDAHLERPPSTVLDVGGSTGVIAGVARDRWGSQATVLDPAPDELAVAQAHGHGDGRGIHGGLRTRRTALGSRLPLPDDRPPARCRRHAAGDTGRPGGRRPRVHRRARRVVGARAAGAHRGRVQDRPSVLPDTRHRSRLLRACRARPDGRADGRRRPLRASCSDRASRTRTPCPMAATPSSPRCGAGGRSRREDPRADPRAGRLAPGRAEEPGGPRREDAGSPRARDGNGRGLLRRGRRVERGPGDPGRGRGAGRSPSRTAR